MTDPLLAARAFLLERYRKLYANNQWEFAEYPGEKSGASWTWQSHDLLDTKGSEAAAGALVTDPDIGVCLYLVNFRHQPKVRETVARALAVRQRLAPLSRTPNLPVDELGEWRVALNWLVENEDLPDWIQQVADIRERTGHFEEVSADVVIRYKNDWMEACERHAFPRLLFMVRQVLAKKDADEIDQWQSADAPVIEELKSLSQAFTDTLTNQCAEEAVKQAFGAAGDTSQNQQTSGAPTELLELGIRHFRNIDQLDIRFRNPPETVAATVIHGPNGSGKSSIFEALSFALCGTSMRHRMYSEDPNRLMWGRQDRYVSDYLLRRQGAAAAEHPAVALNGEVREITAEKLTACADRVDDLAANLFSQECSRSLVSMRASELGAQIAGAFSPIAAAATELVDSALRAAQEEQRAFNYEWGLRGNVTKKDTVLEQVLLRSLRPQLAKSDGLIAWLNGATGNGSLAERMRQYASQLAAWKDDAPKLAKNVRLEGIVEYLRRGEALLGQAREFADGLAATIERWPEDINQSWSLMVTWLRARAERPVSTDDVAAAEESLKALQERIRECAERGNLLRAQRQSLDVVAALLPSWGQVHEDDCPTCGSDVADRGGIREVVSKQIRITDDHLQQARVEYQRLRSDIDRTSKALADLGAAEPPVSPDDQVELVTALELIGERSMDDVAADETSASRVAALLAHLRRVPKVSPESSDPVAIADEIWRDMESVSSQYERVANLPVAWKRVRDELQNRLAGVTARHLPLTVQALWNEFAQNMLPAPWQYPGRLGLKVATSSAGAEVAIVIRTEAAGEALAAHLLNGAEVHNVGLAWFFTQYVIRGRFKYSALAFDDPAHPMDQPTYREFCRLLETVMRLHRVGNIPLSLVLLLHQDARAVDAARSTNGTLHFLRWNYHSAVSLRRIKLHDESIAAPRPVESVRSIRPLRTSG